MHANFDRKKRKLAQKFNGRRWIMQIRHTLPARAATWGAEICFASFMLFSSISESVIIHLEGF